MRRTWLGTLHLLSAGAPAAAEVLATARRAGISWLDTADVYGPAPGDVERFLATNREGFRVATKVGLVRTGSRWLPDGRPGAVDRAIDDVLARLGPVDLLWLHAPDPRTDVRSTARALRRALDDGRVPALGVCNVRVTELRAIAEVMPVAAVQVELSRSERATVRSGVVEEARRRDLLVLASRPFGGNERARLTLADPAVAGVAAKHGVPAAAVVLAWLRGLGVVPIPGTTSPAHLLEHAVDVVLDDEDHARLDAGTEAGTQLRRPRSERRAPPTGREVVLIGGTPGAGKTRRVAAYPDHLRLNRDTLGGTLDGLLPRLATALADGRDVVLDNTYAARAQRNGVVEVAVRHGARVRCEWLTIPDGEAERNVVTRLLDTVGHLVGGPDLARWNRDHAEVLPPRALHRFRREVEVPDDTEGFDEVVEVPFVRVAAPGRAALCCAPEHLEPLHPAVRAAAAAGEAILVAAWAPGGDVDAMVAALEAAAAALGLEAFAAVCPHPGGPPDCWCRKPLPGLLLALARRAGVDPSRVRVLAASPADTALARRLSLEVVAPA